MPGILIMEDDRDLREMLKTSLIRKRYTLLEAENGKDSVMHIKPSITGLVVTDLLMPEEDGLKVIMKLREPVPSINIIAISGGGKAGSGSYLNLAKAPDANSIYSRPSSINEMISRIEDLLDTEQPG